MAPDRTAIVELDGATRRYRSHGRDVVALDDVTLAVRRGEILGVIGESGSGKSTLLRLVDGLERPDAGSVTVDGQRIDRLRGAALRRARHDVGVVFQGVDLLSSRTVRQNVSLAQRIARRSRPAASARDERAAVDEMLHFVGLAARADHFPAQLSGGERQRAGIARALVTRPPLLLCDEPTSSLDAATTAEVLRVLEDARDALGTTVVLVTHDLDAVKAVCDRAALLADGALRAVLDVPRGAARSVPTYEEQVRRELGA